MTLWTSCAVVLLLTALPSAGAVAVRAAAANDSSQAATTHAIPPRAPNRPFYFPPAVRPQNAAPNGPIGRSAPAGSAASLPTNAAPNNNNNNSSPSPSTIASGPTPQGPALPPLVATKQHYFAIPFRITPPQNPGQAPREVQLYVSGDRGATWQLYTRAEPTQRQFLFRAASDGEYWFAVRTVDRQGQARPPKITAPGMRVAIDTAPPRLELSAKPAPGGLVELTWTLEEPLPKLDTLKLSYRVGDQGLWQAIPLETDDVQRRGAITQGKVQWQPYAAGEVQIRAETTDAAGNFAVGHAIVAVGPSTIPNDDTTPTPGNGPEVGLAENRWRSKADAALPSGDYAPAAAHPALAAPTHAPTESGPESNTSAPPAANPTEAPSVDESAVRWVATRQIELEYDINPLAGAVERVEIWGTADRGRSWHLLAVDEDRQSPVLAVVDSDGLWGFRMIVRQAGVAASPAPRPGDAPDLYIGVRTEK